MSSFPFTTILAALLASSCLVSVAQAATIVWGGSTGSWSTATNWIGSVFPGSSDTVNINAGTAALDLSEAIVTITRVNIGGTNNSNGNLVIENGALLTDDYGVIGNGTGATGTVIVSSSNTVWNNTINLQVGFNGTGSLVVSHESVVTADNRLNIGYSSNTTGSMTIQDGGIVRSGTGTIGYSTLSSGVVTVSGNESVWNNLSRINIGRSGNGTLIIQDNGAVIAPIGYIAVSEGSSGIVTITDSGSLTIAQALTIAVENNSTGTLNIGAAAGDAAAAAGTVTASGGVVFGDGTGKIVFNHTSTDYTFANSISGAGTIEADAGTTYLTGDLSGFTGTYDLEGGTLSVVTSGVQTLSNSLSGAGTLAFASGTTYLTGDGSGFTGTAAVSGAGILSVNGSLGGTVDVAAGGTLKGSGTVGGIDAAAGGAVAPGNSIGTLSVVGNVSFASGSTYDVEANATSSDKITATGTATITGGAVSLIPYQGAFLRAGTTYTILTAAGGVTGQFDSISFSEPLLFLTASLSKDANDIYASVLRNGVSFASVAGTSNQAAAATAIESLGSGNAVYDAVAMQSDVATTRQAFQQLDGEIYANIKATLLEDQAVFGRVLAGRLAQAQDNAVSLSAPATAKASAFGPTLWGQGFGGWGGRDGDANASAFKHQDKGLMTGVDTGLGAWRMGFAFGYDRADYDQSDNTKASGTANRYSFSAYGGRSWSKLSLRTGLTYAYSDIDTDRSVSFPYETDHLKASYEAHSLSGFAEAAYGFGGKDSKVEPYANVTWGMAKVPGFTEQGGAAALTVDDSSEALGSATLGARVRKELPFLTSASNRAAFQAMAGWQHALGKVNPDNTMRFAGSSAFKAQAAPLARDAAVLGAGVDYLIGMQTTLGLSYMGQVGAHADTQAVQGNLSYRF